MDGFRQVLWLDMLEFYQDQILGVDPQDNVYCHVSGMERLDYELGMLWDVCLARMSGKWHGHSLRPTGCKRCRGTAYYPGNP
jgi:hypothetical protein